jgi:hypothetical protein
MAEALAKFDESHEFALSEAGVETGRFATIAEAREEVRTTWGEGRQLEWRRMIVDGRRMLVHEQFAIYSVPKKS